MSKINENPESIFEDIKKLLKKGIKDRSHAYHTPTFSNISKNHYLNSRVIVLRKFDEKKLLLNFHTDLRSPKVKDLIENNKSNFLFYDSTIKIQLRIQTISIINNQNNVTKESWNLTSLSSRKCYLTTKAPSSKTTIPQDGLPKNLIGIDPSKEISEQGYKNFTVIENKIKNIDWLYLSSLGHRRLKINFNKVKPEFFWIIP
tara:strand:- start:139 stop:744 length:606 start_codon:yes stop_codon:yes gene_type:complete